MRPRFFFRRSSSVAHGKIRTAGPTLAQDSMSHLCSKSHQECGSLPHLAGGVFCGDASCCPRRSSLWMSQTALIRLFWSLLQNWRWTCWMDMIYTICSHMSPKKYCQTHTILHRQPVQIRDTCETTSIVRFDQFCFPFIEERASDWKEVWCLWMTL